MSDEEIMFVRSGIKNSDTESWTFCLLARMRGWKVSDPEGNGYGYYGVRERVRILRSPGLRTWT